MTAGNNGSDTPENDDPFAYLYRSEGGQGGQSGQSGSAPRTGGYGYPGPHQPGVPRTSYNHVRAVGERTYGQQNQQQYQQGQQQYQQGQQIPNQQAYAGQGQQNPHYAAPETLPGGAPRRAAPSRGTGGRGPNSKGLLIGALAVVAVVVVGIGVAMITNNDDDKKDDKAEPTNSPTAPASVEPSKTAGASKDPSELPSEDAWGLRLENGAAPATDVPGAKGEGGKYVGGLNSPGAAVTWNVEVAKAGQYRLYARYGVPGENQSLSLTVNGERSTRPMNMENFVPAKKGEWEKSWTNTWSLVNLNKGANTLKVSCEAGDKCDVILDQLWLTGKDG
ncbi:CBM35 domain-containing protein [Streptomyces sparsogenes]|uniref:CBM35 domain-containing protein n=1 Tax=Streptomyces sparsogenes TaxID=67365 RepID=UPI0033EABB1A